MNFKLTILAIKLIKNIKEKSFSTLNASSVINFEKNEKITINLNRNMIVENNQKQLYYFDNDSENNQKRLYYFDNDSENNQKQLYHFDNDSENNQKQLYHFDNDSENNQKRLYYFDNDLENNQKQLYHFDNDSENSESESEYDDEIDDLKDVKFELKNINDADSSNEKWPNDSNKYWNDWVMI